MLPDVTGGANWQGGSFDPETNILYVDVNESTGTAKSVCDALREHRVWVIPTGPQRFRAVTHLDVCAEAIDRAIAALKRVLTSRSPM